MRVRLVEKTDLVSPPRIDARDASPNMDAKILGAGKRELMEAVNSAFEIKGIGAPMNIKLNELKQRGVASGITAEITCGVRVFSKVDPAVVALESRNLKYLRTLFPGLFPEIIYSDEGKGILLLKYYSYPTLHELIAKCPSVYDRVSVEMAFKRAYGKLFNIIYEGTLQPGVPDPYEAHLKRIYERVEKKKNACPEFEEIAQSVLRVNGKKVGRFGDVMCMIETQIDKLAAPVKAIVLGDEHPANIFASVTPPYVVIFFDLPNAELEGDDWTKGAGKVLHWLKYGPSIYPLQVGGVSEKDVVRSLNLRIRRSVNETKITYVLPAWPMASTLKKCFMQLCQDFAERHNDKSWMARLNLGEARAWLGSVEYHSPAMSTVLFCEGMKKLKDIRC